MGQQSVSIKGYRKGIDPWYHAKLISSLSWNPLEAVAWDDNAQG